MIADMGSKQGSTDLNHTYSIESDITINKPDDTYRGRKLLMAVRVSIRFGWPLETHHKAIGEDGAHLVAQETWQCRNNGQRCQRREVWALRSVGVLGVCQSLAMITGLCTQPEYNFHLFYVRSFAEKIQHFIYH